MKYFTTLLMPMIWALFALAPNSFAQNTTAEYISQITPPAISDSIPVKDGDRFLTYQNGYLFIVNEWTGVQIADVSDISAPRKTALLRTQDMAHQIDIDENRLYLAQENAGIDVYDISDIQNPQKISNIKTPGDAYWVDADYPYLYAALGNSGFCIMDVSKPNDPRTLSLEIPGNWIWSISHEGNRAYVAAKQGGLLIYDVTDPASPVKLTQYLTPDQVIQVQVEDNIAYIADGPGGLLILDVSAPGLIKELGHFATPGFSRHVFKSGNYAYLSNRENGLLIINVSDPAHPYLEGHYKPQSETYCSYKQDVYVFLATDTKTEILRHNNRPVLNPINNAVIDENSPFVLQLKAHDADGDSLFYEAENLPQGSQFDSTSGLFSWTPGWEQAGIYNGLVFRVIEKTGSRLTDADTINIRVNHINRLPNLPAIANRDIREDSLLIIAVPQASDPDKEDAGKLTYHAENLPQGAQFNAATRTFQWKPTFDQSGTYVVDFVVDDGAGGADREAVTITVRHVDRPPHIQQIADKTIGEGQPLTIQLQGMESDREDKDKIQFSMQNLPPGSAFDAATAQFTWTPGYDQSGIYPGVTAVMKAGALSDTAHFEITVNHVNRPPVLAKIPDQTVDENRALSFKISGSDPDAEDTGKLTYAAENLPAGAAFNADSLTFSWIPDYEQSGSYSNVLFTVKDPQGLTDQKSVNITVNHVNRGPVLQNIPALAVDENQDLKYQLVASDPDKEDDGKLSFSSPDLPKNAMLDTKSGLFEWKPTFEQAGIYRITFTVSDGKLSDSKKTEVTVRNVNRAPLLDRIPDRTVDENQLLSFTVNASDPDSGDTPKLAYAAAEVLPQGAAFDPQSHTFSWKPTFEQSGVYNNILFSATDPEGLTDKKAISITVNHVNRPPVLQPVADVGAEETKPISIQLRGSDPDKEDTGKLAYQIGDLPQGAACNPATGLFTWTPGYDQSGEYTLPAKVSDPQGLSAEQTIHITVRNVNRPPQAETRTTVSGKENEPLSIQLKYSDPDREDQGKLTLSTTNLPPGATLNPANGKIGWTPGYEQGGAYQIIYKVADPAGAASEGTVTLQIANVDRPPVLPEVGKLEGSENAAVRSVLPAASDPDKEDTGNLQYQVQNLPAGAAFDPVSRTLTWTPDFEQAGEYSLTYRVTDTGGLSAQTKISLKIKNTDRAPKLEDIPDRNVKEGENLSFTVRASDPDNADRGKLKFSASGLPSGAGFDSQTGIFSWTPGSGQQGRYQVSFSVSDGEGLKDQKNMKITVENVPPTETGQLQN